MPLPFQHGHIRCGTIVVNDLSRSRSLYCELLNHEIAEQGRLPELLAAAWGAPDLANSSYCLLQPKGLLAVSRQPSSYLRLIQSQTKQQPVAHATTLGWCAFEMNVKDVYELFKNLDGSAFDVVGPPKKMDGISNTIPMQVVGPDQEVFYLNQVLSSDETTDLPIAEHEIDRIFIVVLACDDFDSTINHYAEQLNLNKGPVFELRYSLINRAQNLDPETKHRLGLLQAGKMPVLEIDHYPSSAQQRPRPENGLSLGNAIVSIVVDDLDSFGVDQSNSGEIVEHDKADIGLLYQNARSKVIVGQNNEVFELIEYSKS